MTELNREEWDAFVRGHPDGSFFQLSAWADVTQSVFDHRSFQLTTRRGGALSAVLPLVEVRSRLFGHALIANAFCVGGGPLAVDAAALAEILDQAEQLGRELGVEYIELRDTPSAGPQWAVRDDLYAYFAWTTAADEDANLKQMPRRKRAIVRKTLASNLTTSIDSTTDDFYPLYALNMRNHGTPALPRRFFDRLRTVFGDDCEILTVRDEGRPISSVLSFYFKDRVMPYYMGAHPDARAANSNDLMYWTVMRRGVARGYPVFDFSRSKVGTGPYQFKELWGFQPRPISHQYRLLKGDALPNVNPTNPKYAAFIQLWRQLPLPIATSISPLLSRSLG
jgi:FemAB-related protein (PEP-CTERM system-associated)